MAKIFEYRGRGISDQVAKYVEKKGKIHNCFCISAPQAVEDGQIVIRKTLRENLKTELSPERSGQRKYILPQVLPELRAGKSVSLL